MCIGQYPANLARRVRNRFKWDKPNGSAATGVMTDSLAIPGRAKGGTHFWHGGRNGGLDGVAKMAWRLWLLETASRALADLYCLPESRRSKRISLPSLTGGIAEETATKAPTAHIDGLPSFFSKLLDLAGGSVGSAAAWETQIIAPISARGTIHLLTTT